MPISPFQFRTGGVVRRTVSLNGTVIQSGATAGTFVGDIRPVPHSGILSNVVLTDNVGNRFALDGTDIEAGAVATDFAVETFHNITVSADVDGYAVSRVLRVDVAFVDTIAPTVLAGVAFDTLEDVVFSVQLSADESVIWTKVGGADQALFTLTGGGLLELSAQDFEAPADVGSNNTYVVQVRATDQADNQTDHTITVTVLDEADPPPDPPPGARVAGLSYTPSIAAGDPYDVPSYTLPATFAAIDSATYPGALNVNSYANLEAAIDAANAANSGTGAHLAVGIDSGVGEYTLGSTKRYLKKSLIGFGSSKPGITCTTRSPQLFGHTYDVDICGFRIINAGYFFNMIQEALPLRFSAGGSLDLEPWWTLSNQYYLAAGPGGNSSTAAAFRMQRCGKLTPSGSGDVTSITAWRQIEGTVVQFFGTAADYPGVFQQVPLISGTITAATPTSIRDAINAFTGTSGFSAILSLDGLSILILRTGKGYPLELRAVTTGTLTLGMIAPSSSTPGGIEINTLLNNTCGIDWRMLNCDLIDCNQGVGAMLDVTMMGEHHFHTNDCPGTWTGFLLDVTRYKDSYAVNNKQYDCMTTRTTAPGRTSSRQPQGNGSGFNVFLGLGNEGAARMSSRYLANKRYWDNNEAENVESLNNIDSNQSATFFDARFSRDRSYVGGIVGGRISHSWNKGTHVYGVQGGVDCQFFYGKERGAKYEHNLLDNCAAPYVNTTLYGSDAAIVMKANSPSASMEEFGYRYSRWKNMSRGVPCIYSDASFNNVIEYCHFENWISPYRNGTSILTSAAYGCVFIYAQIGRVIIRNLYFKNCNALTSHLINLHAVDIFGASTDFHINNCYFQNDGSGEYPAYTGDVNLIRLNIASGMPADLPAYLNASQINHNYTLNAAGGIVGRAKIFVTNNSTSYDIRNSDVVLATPRFNGIDDTGLPLYV